MRELADMYVGLAEYDKREKENVTVDAAKPRHLVAAAGHMLASFRQNLLHRYEKVVTHHVRDDLLHQSTTEIILIFITIIYELSIFTYGGVKSGVLMSESRRKSERRPFLQKSVGG